MESRFSKYKKTNTSDSNKNETAEQIVKMNNLLDRLYNEGLDTIEAEIKSLQKKIDAGYDNSFFPEKIELLSDLGEKIEQVYAIYHKKKDNNFDVFA